MTFSFDLGAIDTVEASERGAWLHVKGIDGRPLLVRGAPVKLRLGGPDCDRYRLALHRATEASKAALDTWQKAADAARNSGADVPLQPDLRDITARFLAEMTLDWSGVCDVSGVPVALSQDAARALYERFPAIREQADSFVATRGNFTASSASAS